MSAPPPPQLSPTPDDIDDLLLSCRYGELEDVQAFVARFGAPALVDARDDRGNTVLHMVCANGHLDVLTYLLPLLPPDLSLVPNNSKSLPIHWATLNRHLPLLQHLLRTLPSPLSQSLLSLPNSAGKSALGVAEDEGWEPGANWLVGEMEVKGGREMVSDVPEGERGAGAGMLEEEGMEVEGQGRVMLGGEVEPEPEPEQPPTSS